jgi:GYF domain 2
MEYLVRRGEEQFGPYSLTELQEYVQAGRVLPGDMAKSEGMVDWVPVSQILGNIPIPVAAPAVSVAPPQNLVALPPNLHWAVLLVLVLLTRQLFNWIWAFVLANWARRLSGSNTSMVLVAMYPGGIIAGIVAFALSQQMRAPGIAVIGGCLILGGAIAYIVGIFKIKAAMEDYYNSTENIGLVLSGVMSFFFSSVYLQYHVNSIARWKKTGVLS